MENNVRGFYYLNDKRDKSISVNVTFKQFNWLFFIIWWMFNNKKNAQSRPFSANAMHSRAFELILKRNWGASSLHNYWIKLSEYLKIGGKTLWLVDYVWLVRFIPKLLCWWMGQWFSDFLLSCIWQNFT